MTPPEKDWLHQLRETTPPPEKDWLRQLSFELILAGVQLLVIIALIALMLDSPQTSHPKKSHHEASLLASRR